MKKIAIIVGAGAVENAWTPIQKAFRQIWRCEVDSDAANCIFAKHIYLLRFYSSYPDIKAKENLNDELDQVNIIKELICTYLKEAQDTGILKPRKEFADILNKFVFPYNMIGLVSTNWDTVIDRYADELVTKVYKDVQSAKCFHLHGNIETSKYLYLPSETARENYRSESENDVFGYNHYSTIKFLLKADQIILYGLSLDPLDAELGQVLNSGCSTNKNLKEVVIINPEYQKVRNRLKFILFNEREIKITCYTPDNLNDPR
jgi:hypothetical protein